MCARYRFDTYTTPNSETSHALAKAREYASNPRGKWFYICGVPGSGKTHLCIGICNELLNNGYEVRYMLWREVAPQLKSLVTDGDAYTERMDALKKASVLYIDDFLKGKVSDADINLAFELLNARYNDASKCTIISSERSIEDVLGYDEAVGSRIAERSKGFRVAAPKQNWRLK